MYTIIDCLTNEVIDTTYDRQTAIAVSKLFDGSAVLNRNGTTIYHNAGIPA